MTSRAKGVLALVRRHPFGADAGVAVMFAGAALASGLLSYEDDQRVDPTFRPPATAIIVAAMLATTLPLAWRRRAPPATVALVSAALVGGRLILDVYESSATVLACYLAIYSAVFVLVYNAVILVLPWWLGGAMPTRSGRERELLDQADELRREREENARRAVFEERVRIARELHDVVAHHVSLMGVQAGAARRVMARRPDQAEAALSAIEGASRQAVLEMDRLLGFLRREGEADSLTPQPDLGQLDALMAQVGRAGLAVELVVERDHSPRSIRSRSPPTASSKRR